MPRQPDDAPAGWRPRSRGRLNRWWAAALAIVLAVSVVLVVTRRHDLTEALHLISRVRPPDLAVPLLLETLSLVCFAAVQRTLLRSGGVRWSLPRVTGFAVAGNAMAGTLPGGTAFAALWGYRQLTRRLVEPVLAGVVLAVTGALSGLALLLLLAVGAVTAGALVGPVLGAGAGLAALALMLLLLARLAGPKLAARRLLAAGGRRFRRLRRAEDALTRDVDPRAAGGHGVLLSVWLRPFLWALLYWLCDAACLVACCWALGIGPPWHSLLLAYALAQVVGSLRVTPGSLVVFETSLSTLLVAHGLPSREAIAVTLLYRIFNYWLPQLVGWVCWVAFTARGRHRPAGTR
ncbi:YbhN family protein [Streptomyces sp. DSM 44915]|uniref:YbhN family protein n=1 Tax=Streptomyces chisholmiae TaxID=3075540 RepID=A0ABU2JZM7_9ACTN|nr:YbhN family protein [Streptomyces sp. DSM 44915]MDT0270204.1 YbhN family protein [Streptomyces sp. DSM 44915]